MLGENYRIYPPEDHHARFVHVKLTPAKYTPFPCCRLSLRSTDGAGGPGSPREPLPRTGSVAPFFPPRRKLSPAEEKAYFILLPTPSPEGSGGPVPGSGDGNGGSVGSNSLTVFSEARKLLGFYEAVRLLSSPPPSPPFPSLLTEFHSSLLLSLTCSCLLNRLQLLRVVCDGKSIGDERKKIASKFEK